MFLSEMSYRKCYFTIRHAVS